MNGSPEGLLAWAGDHPARVVGRRVVVSPRTRSTHDDARRIARSLGADAHGLVLTTLEQTGGRGTRGRAWWSPRGRSLALSAVWAPRPALARPAALTLAAALAVVRVSEPRGASLALRWPNDVVTRDGRKVAGVLAETLSGAPAVHVVGIGVNVLDPPGASPFPIDRPLGSLESAGAAPLAPADLFGDLLAALEVEFASLGGTDGAARLAGAVEERSWLAGRRVTLRRGEETREGTYRGITRDLEVVIDADGGGTTRWPGEQVELLGWR